jgi:hypothetical protein
MLRRAMVSILTCACLTLIHAEFISVTSPSGGEEWMQGNTQSITWDNDLAVSEQVKISLYMDLTFVDELAVTSCTGSYEWTIPETYEQGYNFRIRIEKVSDPSVFGNGSVFSILSVDDLFTESGISLPGLSNGSVSWGDFDNDGNLDLILTGYNGSSYVTKIYKNNGNESFSSINLSLPANRSPQASWFDYNNDGFLDFVIIGEFYSTVYRNNGNSTFTNVNADLPVVTWGSVTCGDLDNDGLQDVIITGYGFGDDEEITKIFRNNGDGSFTEVFTELPQVFGGYVAIGDYNNDGLNDLLVTGIAYSYGNYTGIYKNMGNMQFRDIGVLMQGVKNSTAAWGDFNNDGLADVIVSGYSAEFGYSAKIYRNDGDDSFADINAAIPGVSWGSANWGDYNNDGYLDVCLSGHYADGEEYSFVCRNNGNETFTEMYYLSGTGSSQWGDYDKDGNLDVIISGYLNNERSTKIIKNNIKKTNACPSAPVGLNSIVETDRVILSWDHGSDNESSSGGVTYNIAVGTSPGGSDIFNPLSMVPGGKRKIVSAGNTGKSTSFVLKNLGSRTYYWSVQAIDNSNIGSEFSAEATFYYSAPDPTPPIAYEAEEVDRFSFVAKWSSTGDKGYNIDLFFDSFFTDPVPGFGTVNAFNNTYYRFTNLESDRIYYYRVRSYNGDGNESGNSNTVCVTALHNPFEDINAGLPGISNGSTAWVDFDNDGFLDAFLFGNISDFELICEIYRNNGNGTFTKADTGLPSSSDGKAAWADFDNDGYVDVLISTWDFTRIYRNNGDGSFSAVNTGIPRNITAVWGDYNNDGLKDVLAVDYTNTTIHRNNGDGTFTDIVAGLQGLMRSSAAWGDYNNDGFSDIIISGTLSDGSFSVLSYVYRNNKDGTFSEINAGVVGVEDGYSGWFDYNNDGLLDILVSGAWNYSTNHTKIYRNNGDDTFTFLNEGVNIIGAGSGTTSWTDINSDGFPDILISGRLNYPPRAFTDIYINNADGTFSPIEPEFPGVFDSSSAWGDFDNDGKIDLLLTGESYSESGLISRIFRNKNALISNNTRPNSPENLYAEYTDSLVNISWDRAYDLETPQAGLSYNIYIGRAPGNTDIVSPLSDVTTGFRKIAEIGNANQNVSWSIKGLEPGTYYWSVQSVDQGFSGSEFAPEQVFTVTGIEDEILPLVTTLYQNYPNPFNPATAIRYSLAADADVKLAVFDITGRSVAELVSGRQERGNHSVNFNADGLTSGIYLYRLSVDGKAVQSKKMMMLK